jgi:hypothetical protein
MWCVVRYQKPSNFCQPLKERIFRQQNLNFHRPLADRTFSTKNTHFSLAPTKVTHFTLATIDQQKLSFAKKKKDQLTARATTVGPSCCHHRNGEVTVSPASEWGGCGAATAHRSEQLSSLTSTLKAGIASPTPLEGGGRRRVTA